MKVTKLLKGVLIGLAVLALLLWTGGLVLNHYLEDKLIKQSFSGYQFDSVQVKVSLFTLSISLNNLVLNTSDSSASRIRIKKFKAGGINPFKIMNNGFSTRSISINGVDAFLQPLPADTLFKSADSSSRDFKISTNNLSVEIDRFLWLTEGASKSDTTFYAEARLSGSNLKWKTEDKSSGYPFTYNDILLNIPYARLGVMDSLYSLHFYELELDTRDSIISLELVRFATNYERYEIGAVTGLQRDWLDISAEKLRLLPVDFNKFISDTTLLAGALHMEKFKARAFKDKRRTFPDKPDTKLPDEMLRSIPFGLRVDSVIMHTGEVEYAERAEGSSEEGKVTFKQLQAKISNVGNRARFLRAPTIMKASAMFMDKGYLNATFDIPNPAHEVTYKVLGALHSMPLKSLNSILPQSAGAEITSGRLERLDFNFVYNNDVSDGELAFQYQDLNVNLIDKSDKSDKKILSAIVNGLVVPTSNVAGNDNFKKGTIHSERNKKKAIFNFWWHSLFSGLKSTIL